MSSKLPDRFELLEELATDSAKSLLRCQDRMLLREVVLQMPGSARFAQISHDDRDRMLREARMLARVHHPGVCRLLEIVETPSGPIMVLEPRAGETLEERLEQMGRLAPDEVRHIGRSISDAVEAVHAVGVVHRGIAETNILLQADGSVVLTGFEFSKAFAHGFGVSSINYNDAVATLPSHPAPEQLEGRVADARSDVFALGCVLYRALTGQAPFPDRPVLPWSPPTDPVTLVPDAPLDLLNVIQTCLQQSPLKRFATMADLRQALGPEVKPDPAPSTTHAEEPPPPRRFGWPLRIVLAVGIVALVLFYSRGWPPFSKPIDRHDPIYGQSHALLIGIDYTSPPSDFPRLWNAEEDVRAIEEHLLELDWRDEQIHVLTGPAATKSAIESTLRTIENAAGPEDQVFIYYSGHGMRHERSEKSGFAIPIDARNDPERTNWLHFDAFDRVFDHSEAKHILIALDCCYSGAFLSRSTTEEYNYSETLLTRRAHLMMVSSRDGLAADATAESPDHSPFATAFLNSLEEAIERPRTATHIQAKAQDLVQSQTWVQAPVLYHRLRSSSGTSDFVFMKRSPADSERQ